MRYKQQFSNGLLIAFIILENLFLYYFFEMKILTTGKNAIGLFLSSLMIGIIVLYKFYNADASIPAPKPVKGNILSYIMILVVITCLIILGGQYADTIKSSPVDVNNSDILPSIQIMCRRFVHGQYPYSIINDFGFPQQVAYLPMHWMPFAIGEKYDHDYRWISYIAWCIAALVLSIRTIKAPSFTLRIVSPILILASYYVLFTGNPWMLTQTVELLIAAYYMVLIAGLDQKNGIVQGFVISLCLLSRYSVVLWLPLYCFVLFITQNRKQLYLSASTAFLIVVLVYVIPFLSKDWALFYHGYKGYDAAAFGEWTRLDKFGVPVNLYKGNGFAYFFYSRFTHLDVMSRIKLLQRTQLLCSILITVVLGIWFRFNKDKINHKIFLMSSFKIYFAVFLFLIQVPYQYLMWVGNFVSIAIFCEQARYRVTRKNVA